MKETGFWVPSTPGIHFPSITRGASEALDHDGEPLERSEVPSILGAVGQEAPEVAKNVGLSWSNNRASDCVQSAEDYRRVVAAKVGFIVTPNSETADMGANPKTTDGVKWMEGNQPNIHFRSESMKASSMQKNQTPQKRRNKDIDLNRQPRKRMRMKKHRPKVFDVNKPKKTSKSNPSKTKTPIPKTPKPKTPRNANFVKKESLNIPVDPVNDTGGRGRRKSGFGKSSSKRKLDFCRENQVLNHNLNMEAAAEFKWKEGLNLPVDSRYCDFDGSSRVQNLVFSLKNKGVNKTEAELKKVDLNIRVDSLKDSFCSRQTLDFNCRMNWDLKPSNVVENETEIEQNKHGLNLPVDASYCDLDGSSSVQNLVFSLKNNEDNETEAELKKENQNIRVDSLKDPSCRKQCVDFSCSMDWELTPSNVVENETEVEPKRHDLNLPVDASYCDLDGSSSMQNLVFSLKNKEVNETEAELKKQDPNIRVDSLKDPSCSRQSLDVSCSMDCNLKPSNVVENETEVEPKKHGLNLPVDPYCDLNGSSSVHNLVFSLKNKGDNETEAELKKGDLNIRADSLKDPSCSRTSHFSCIMDRDLKPSNVVENETEVELKKHSLNISVDSLKDDCDVSSTEENVNFRVENCMMDQNLKGESFNGMKVYQRRVGVLKSNLDKNSMACGGEEDKHEVESNLHFTNRSSPFKVYRRKSHKKIHSKDVTPSPIKVYERKFPKKIHEKNVTPKSCDGTVNEQELQSEVPSDRRFRITFSRRKIFPKFPNLCKKKRKRQQRRRVFDIKFDSPFSRPQRVRRMSERLKLYSIVENSKKKSSTKDMPTNDVKRLTSDSRALKCSWRGTAKRNGVRVRRQRFSCIFKFYPSNPTRKRRSKMSSRRKDILSLNNIIRSMQDFIKLKSRSPELNSDNPNFIPKTPLEHSPELSPDNGDFTAKALLDYLVMIMESLHIYDDDDETKQLVVRDQTGQGELVTSKVKIGPSKKQKNVPKVDLDSETIRVWNLLMESGRSEEKDQQDDKAEYWREQREIFTGRVESFLARTHFIQGDRRFSQWKGSVVDSVVGVFLTQNVSDHLSSSAFMNLAAKYPPSLVEDPGYDDKSDHVNEIQYLTSGEPPSARCDEFSIVQKYPSVTPSNIMESEMEDVCEPSSQMQSTTEIPKENAREKQENKINWDDLRTKVTHGKSRIRTSYTRDSVNWEAVRQASVAELANVINERGMSNMLSIRIKNFLDRLVRDHGSIDLEWLRDVEPDKSKDYLLSIPGLGLKSVECVRLLALRHHAFPVDTNVARILVRLGWVPLQTLPGDLQMHLLNDYPPLDTIQKYIWPRLCHLIIDILYEFHYHIITYGKLICTKKHPNCNACPMKAECRHFASACASAKLRLDGTKDKHMPQESSIPDKSMEQQNQPMLPVLNCAFSKAVNCEPIIQYPPSPEPEMVDIEDTCYESNDDDIPTIKLNTGEFTLEKESKALVALSPEVASIPMPKLKYVGRLKTVHYVYELPDEHPLLVGYEKRDLEDRCPYLLAIWNSNELTDSFQDSSQGFRKQESGEIVQYQNHEFVLGTILIPIRTANRGSFPLNGTYFQTNEVTADHETSKHPIAIPRGLIWNLNRRFLYCGTSATSICRGMSMEEITAYNRRGYMCIRGFDRATRAPRPLARRFHLCKTRKVDNDS